MASNRVKLSLPRKSHNWLASEYSENDYLDVIHFLLHYQKDHHVKTITCERARFLHTLHVFVYGVYLRLEVLVVKE